MENKSTKKYINKNEIITVNIEYTNDPSKKAFKDFAKVAQEIMQNKDKKIG